MTNRHLADLRNEIKIEANDSIAFEVEAFARVFASRLEEAEQVFDLNVEALQCRGPHGRRLELLGYAEDATDDSLTLLAGRYFGSDSTLTLTDATEVLGRATGFIESAGDGWLSQNLEPSSREAEYAGYFRQRITTGSISKIRVVLITDGVMSDRIRTIVSNTVAGLKTTYEIWDQRRITDAALPDRGSEDIRVDFTKWLPDGLPCLIASGDDDSTKSYLAVIPARVLADVFDEYGSLLLESNVRTFLSAKGQVNRGIQATLAQEPERFLAYNNGLTTTATEVRLGHSSQGRTILGLDRWQIVNGGQTTASIAHFLRNNKDKNVDTVQIQMKLVTVNESDSAMVVQAVAKYANSQNKVSGADLFSTHEFHVRMEQISRRLKVAKEGQQYQTGWFYERARGQWENDWAACGSASEQRKFELEYPKVQRITKTDWAKFNYCWDQYPHLVSKGAQSVIADYAEEVKAQWTRDGGKGTEVYGDGYFCTSIGKAILYEALRLEVIRQDWYKDAPGYLANIVAYSIARFSFQIDMQFGGAKYDFSRVWQRQRVSDQTLATLIEMAHAAQRHLTDPSRPQANVTQWAKQHACWEGFKKTNLTCDAVLKGDLISATEARVRVAEDRKQRVMDTGIEAVTRILAIKPEIWATVQRSMATVPASSTETDLVRLFGLRKGNVPSDRQAAALLRFLDRIAESGAIGRDTY